MAAPRLPATPPGAPPAGPPPAAERGPWAVMTVVGVGTLLGAMASSMVSLALPAIGQELAISLDRSRWVVQAFLLATTVLLLLAGRAGDILGHGRVYLAGTALFGLAALACGLAPRHGQTAGEVAAVAGGAAAAVPLGFVVLVAARAAQGVGAAMIAATAPALLTLTFPPRQRGRALGLFSTATYVGLTAAPTLGGLIIGLLGWRWTFFLNLPVAGLTLALGLRYLPRSAGPRGDRRFDLPGAATLITGLGLLFLGLSQAGRAETRGLPAALAAAAGLAALAGFVLIERASPYPLLDLGLFRSRIFTGSVASAVANYASLFVVMILLPFYLIEGLGLSAQRAGLILSVQPLLMALAASPSGWLSDRIGSRALATAGLLVSSAGMLGLASLGPESAPLAAAGFLAVVGFGTGVFISPNSSALMGAAPRHRQGTAGSVLGEARSLGMLLGVVLATAVFAAGGGRTGAAWRPADFAALHGALTAAAAVGVAGAAAASLRGRHAAGLVQD